MDKAQRRGRAPRALAESVDRLTRPLFARRGFAGGVVVKDWPLIVGESLAAGTLPERIVYPDRGRSDGTLHLRVASGGLAAEMQHLEPQLVERINGYFGYRAVVRIRFFQRPLPERRAAAPPAVRPLNRSEEEHLDASLTRVADGDLRSALDGLGRAVMGRCDKQGFPQERDLSGSGLGPIVSTSSGYGKK